jgi:hypothetical protein
MKINTIDVVFTFNLEYDSTIMRIQVYIQNLQLNKLLESNHGIKNEDISRYPLTLPTAIQC